MRSQGQGQLPTGIAFLTSQNSYETLRKSRDAPTQQFQGRLRGELWNTKNVSSHKSLIYSEQDHT